MSVELRAGGLVATIEADAFLRVGSLQHNGDELLMSADELPERYVVHGRSAGITLMHPWANRLSRDRFQAQLFEARVDTEPGLRRDAGGLPIHGLAAEPGAWELHGPEDTLALARLERDASPGFPFPHIVEVRFELEPSRLVVETTLRATTDEPVPLLLGWHPYMSLHGIARSRFQLALPPRLHHALDDRMLPTGDVLYEPAEVAPLGTRTFDDHYSGLAGGTVMALAGGGRVVRLVLSRGFPHAQVFAPPDADVVAFEPMCAPIDALVTGNGIILVNREEPTVVRFAFEVATSGAPR